MGIKRDLVKAKVKEKETVKEIRMAIRKEIGMGIG